jgi:hypothetical protein
MSIPAELKKQIRRGDYTLIQELYEEIHSMGDDADHKTVSIEYIRLVLGEHRPAEPGTMAEEIEAIAKKLLEHRQNFISDLLIV